MEKGTRYFMGDATDIPPEWGITVFCGCMKLNSFEVSEANSHYASIDGVLYDKSGETLIWCPAQKESITIPDSIKNVKKIAFSECENLTDVYYAGTEAQWNALKLDSLKNVTIHFNPIEKNPTVEETVPESPVVEETIPENPIVEETIPENPAVEETVPENPAVEDSSKPEGEE